MCSATLRKTDYTMSEDWFLSFILYYRISEYICNRCDSYPWRMTVIQRIWQQLFIKTLQKFYRFVRDRVICQKCIPYFDQACIWIARKAHYSRNLKPQQALAFTLSASEIQHPKFKVSRTLRSQALHLNFVGNQTRNCEIHNYKNHQINKHI